jgi:hypothetical protein
MAPHEGRIAASIAFLKSRVEDFWQGARLESETAAAGRDTRRISMEDQDKSLEQVEEKDVEGHGFESVESVESFEKNDEPDVEGHAFESVESFESFE